MAHISRTGKEWSRKKDTSFSKVFKNLHTQLTWRELLVGFVASALFAAILSGYREQEIPEFELDHIANQNVRASKDVYYVDEEATALKLSEATASIPSIYELDRESIANAKESLRNMFQRARTYLNDRSVPAKGDIRQQETLEILTALKLLAAASIPDDVLQALLRERFSSTVENKIIKILDTVLREGIIGDTGRFEDHQRTGITIRDNSFPFEHPLTDATLV